MLRTILPLAAAAALIPATAAQGAALPYAGETETGAEITFTVKRDRVTGLRTLVPAACANTYGSTGTDGGLEVYRPDRPLPLGGERKFVKTQPSAVSGHDVDMTYTFDAARRGKAISGKLGLSWSSTSFDVFTMTSTITTCFSTLRFDAQPAR
ncbi:MAG TPA: hypothetical protein VIL49_02235 [Capillimicrobium sp.]|jgi:hypothetical protein